MTILDQIVAYKRTQELPQRMASLPLEQVAAQAAAAPAPRNFLAALRSHPGTAVIAEVKRASPSKGILRQNFDPLELAQAYAANGAAAISVLTDEAYFQGSLGYLDQIRQRVEGIPLLRKDFIVHPYQVYEARAHGADAILLIAAVLDTGQMKDLLALARELGMEALIEVHTAAQMSQALEVGGCLVGVNNRDLRDFSVSLETCIAIRPLAPPGVCLVAESGIHTRSHVKRLAAAGINAILVGEALVTSADPGKKLKELTSDD